ncbi:MAG: thioredoxin [Euryarchaeota archaeon RBG_16_62_10]|nr:MAG: thioredoxin [Euryarchaeota archaeon RBG_16_62_10]
MSTEIEKIRAKKMAEMMEKAGSGQSGGNAWPEAPVTVTDADFDSFVKKYPKVVVDCWAPWCGPCRMIAPTIEAMAKDHKGKVVYAKLNTDDNIGVAGKYRIMSIPTLLFFKDGQLVDKMIGAAPRVMLEQQIRKTLG